MKSSNNNNNHILLLFLTMTQGSRIYDAVYSLDWNLLPLKYRRTYQLMVLHAQRTQVFYVADVKPLNMELFLHVSSMLNISNNFMAN